VIHVPKADVYKLGDSNAAEPIFRDLDWVVRDGEKWAVLDSGSGKKAALSKTLLGYSRIKPPPPGGVFPLFPSEAVAIVSFGNRQRAAHGAFYDYTARYGAVRDEDRITLRQSMFPETIPRERFAYELDDDVDLDRHVDIPAEKLHFFNRLVEKMGLSQLLDLPVVALSNGQTRRARIIKAILSQPRLLLLDEPLTGLDVHHRPALLDVLHALHQEKNPRMVLGLRTQDPVPDWITHIALVRGQRVITGPAAEVLADEAAHQQRKTVSAPFITKSTVGDILIDLQGVNVKYADRSVLKNIHWQIREGERWHLQGPNGSGKTTLLALLTGDHPQSYTQRPPMRMFARTRAQLSTPHLHSLIGVVSPELFDAFPRRGGMTVWDVVGTGFDGVFVPRGQARVGEGVMAPPDVPHRLSRMREVLDALGPAAWGSDGDVHEAFEKREFVGLSIGEQRMVLLMRALVGRPPLVLLDEVWSGMDERMVNAARAYLRGLQAFTSRQAVVVITHWEDEVPWSDADGVKRFRLQDGSGDVV
ncbi:P-loop containing nucleoside triphosphate hydrolase protein, partial [Fistulina hepatica ATCC 64428]